MGKTMDLRWGPISVSILVPKGRQFWTYFLREQKADAPPSLDLASNHTHSLHKKNRRISKNRLTAWIPLLMFNTAEKKNIEIKQRKSHI